MISLILFGEYCCMSQPSINEFGIFQLHVQWDEGLMTMSKGEKAELIIEPEWGYGKKGNIDAKYPLLILEIKIVILRYKFSEQVL